MLEVPASLAWGPGLVGLALALVVYGVALGQYGFYLRAFPLDRRALKILVLFIFVLDTLHSYGLTAYYWLFLVSCHRVVSQGCSLVVPWQTAMAGVCQYFTIFIVQSFYSHRLWIISGHNKSVTGAVLTTAFTQIVLGIWCVLTFIHAGSPSAARITLVTASSAAGLSVICDMVITSSIFFYLRPQRSGIKRLGTSVQQLIDVFVSTGLLTCLASLAVFILLWVPDGQYWLPALTPMLCKCYANSLLAILNARKSIRKDAMRTLELPTMSTPTTESPSSSNSGQ
ncbi:hypothetical protein BV22DRAFT_1133392 [Leucogyrophana mollusca]|uniref:Uncharacterized protein n=1 Tax=Leucogyrophana mollusca TaxID=85980 RepID=A0ACB8B5P4_9AGAM|nr:hypothetical protein BV22DRAFT_1133392 [Leucogyrophana mollusca]